MPEMIDSTPNGPPMGAMSIERMLMLPGTLEFRMQMVRLNGGQKLDRVPRTPAAIMGPAALRLDWSTGKAVEEDLLIRAGRTGVISLDAPVVFKGSFFAALMGAVTGNEIAGALYEAANDPEIDRIVLDMHCPGGQCAGLSDLVEAIDAAAAAKPVISYVHEMSASLAYWLACRTHTIVSSPSGEVGSIGAFAIAYDTSDMLGKMGVRAVPITEASQKGVGHMGVPIDEAMAQRELARIRDIGAEFRASVTAKTGISDADLLAMQGAMHHASTAMKLGLIDGVAPVGAFYAAVQAGEYDRAKKKTPGRNTTTTSSGAAAQNEEPTMTIDISKMTAEDKTALRAALAEDKKKDDENAKAEGEEPKKPEETTEEKPDDEKTVEEEEKNKPAARAAKGPKPSASAPAAPSSPSALSASAAKQVCLSYKMPESVANAMAIEAEEKGWDKTDLLGQCVLKMQDPGYKADAGIEAKAAGSPNPVGGGSAAGGSAGAGGSAQARIDALAAEMVAKNPSMSPAGAKAKVIRENDALREQWVEESNAA